MRNRTFFVLLAMLTVGGLAFSQTILGQMFKLGSSTEAGLPTSSSTLTGALIYDSDDAGVMYNNGAAWVPLLSSANINSFASGYWVDAGDGYMASATRAGRADGGIPFYAFAARGTGIDANTAIAISGGNSSTTYGAIRFFQSDYASATALRSQLFGSTYTINTGTNGQTQGLNIQTLSGNGVNFAFGSDPATNWGSLATGSVYISESGIRLWTNGTHGIDFGSGANDRAVSDGTGITTASYWASTRSIASGPGLVANTATLTGGASSNLTATNAATLGAGVMLNNTSFGEVWQGQSGSGFKPMGAPHNAIDRQTLSTRILGTAKATFPEVVERIPCDSFGGTGALVQMYWSRAATSTTTSSTGRTYLGIATGDATQPAYGYTACSSASTTAYTTVLGATSTSGHLNFCQRVQAGTDITNTIYWVLLTSATPANDATTLTAAGFGFRYAASVGSTWYACYYNGSNTCVNTNVTVSASGEYLLCAYQTGSNLLTFSVNGFVTNTAATISTLSNAYPLVWVDATSGTLKVLGVGPMTVESE